MLKQVTTVFSTVLTLWASAQSAEWLTTGNTGQNALTDFLGNTDGIPMNIRTQDIRRFTLLPDAAYTIGNPGDFPSQVRDGALLLSPDVDGFISGGAPGPFTALHWAGVGVNWQEQTFRPWMRNGVTFTGNSDHGYIGQKCKLVGDTAAEISDKTDMVAHWSGDPGGIYGPDRFRHIFTGGYTRGVPYGWHSIEGLEAMRMTPVDSAHVNVGIGDFYRAGIINGGLEEPTERLHVSDGTIRIDSLLPDYRNDTLNRVLMTDMDGRVHWRSLSTWPSTGGGIGGGSACIWTKDSLSTPKVVRSGLGAPSTGGNCPDRGWLYNVGQATGSLNGKFNIYQNSNERNVGSGLNVTMITNTAATAAEHYGIRVSVTPASGQSSPSPYGIRTEVSNPAGGVAFGTHGKVTKANSSSVTNMYGAYGTVDVQSGGVGTTVYGTWGRSQIFQGSASTSVGSYGTSEVTTAAGTVNISKGAHAVSKVDNSTVTSSFGLHAVAYGTNSTITDSYGVYADSYHNTTVPQTSHGLWARGSSGAVNYGVKASAQGNSASTNYGVYGSSTSAGTSNYSIYGVVPTGGSVANWAGFFTGSISVAGTVYPSDENLKTDIQDLQGPTELLMQLRPKSYTYRHEEFPQMDLPDGLRYGFIAQDVQEAFPQFTTPVHQPEQLDSLGNEVLPAVDYLGLSTSDIIPILVGAAQEHHTSNAALSSVQSAQADELQALRDRMEHLEQLLAACCAKPGGSQMIQQPTGTISADAALDTATDRKLRIVPNPFSEPPTVFYTLDRAGRMQLIANSADGKELNVLQEANMQAGDYQFAWDTTNLAPGMYYVTLLMDGKPLVKKAVKVMR